MSQILDRRPSAILAQTSVNLYAVALVWILPNLSFATAVLTGARHV